MSKRRMVALSLSSVLAIAACTSNADSSVTDRALRTRGDESFRSISGDQSRQASQVGGPAGTPRELEARPIGVERLGVGTSIKLGVGS